MRSRLKVGEILRASGIPAVEFRASIVIGAGSLSFEMIRALVQRLPIMVTPRWVTVQAQPIAIDDVLAYLVAALDLPPAGARVFEIGGGAVTTYRGLMQEYARQRGTRRLFLPVPLLTPHLSSLWLGLVTPLFARVGRKLIESITVPSVVRDAGAARAVRDPPVRLPHRDPPGPCRGGCPLRCHPLGGRPLRPRRRAAPLGRGALRHPPGRLAHGDRRRNADRGVRTGAGHRRRRRLVLRQRPVAPARSARPAGSAAPA